MMRKMGCLRKIRRNGTPTMVTQKGLWVGKAE